MLAPNITVGTATQARLGVIENLPLACSKPNCRETVQDTLFFRSRNGKPQKAAASFREKVSSATFRGLIRSKPPKNRRTLESGQFFSVFRAAPGRARGNGWKKARAGSGREAASSGKVFDDAPGRGKRPGVAVPTLPCTSLIPEHRHSRTATTRTWIAM